MLAEARQDAVVVIPGIMGSELVDNESGKVVWGLRRAAWYVDAWSTGRALRTLAVSPVEREGDVSRLRATGLLRFPAFAPFLRGFEPYTHLVRRLREAAADPAAVLEFPYDWRLPVEYNTQLLANAIEAHLRSWRSHPAHDVARRRQADDRPARLVLVAHSMGGLLCRGLSSIAGAFDDVRAVLTLGTPFDGAPEAALILNTGHGAPVPMPHRRMRDLAKTLPGLYDLLPHYRCVDLGHDARRLSLADVEALGGEAELAANAQRAHARVANLKIPGHRALVGMEQPTVQGLRIRNGVAHATHHGFRVRQDGELARQEGELIRVADTGDGTVPRSSAMPVGFGPAYIAQQHGSLARIDEALTLASSILAEQDTFTGPRLGDVTGVGMAVPDVVEAGAEWQVTVTGVEPGGAMVQLTQLDSTRFERLPLRFREGKAVATVPATAPGLHRVVVSAGSTSPVSQLVLVV